MSGVRQISPGVYRRTMWAGRFLDGSAPSVGSLHTIITQFNTTASQMWVDGVSDAQGNIGTRGPPRIGNGLTVGIEQDLATNPLHFEGYDLVRFTRLLTTTEKNEIGGYFAAKYGVPFTPIP